MKKPSRPPSLTWRELTKPVRGVLSAVVLFSFCANLLSLAVPLFLVQVYDRVLPSRSTDSLLLLALVAVFAVATGSVLEAARMALLARVGTWAEVRLGGRVLAGVIEKARRNGSPSVQGLRDLQTIRQFLGGGQILPLLDAPWAPVFIGVLFILHPLIGALALAGALLLFVLAVINNALSSGPAKAAGDAESNSLELAASVTRSATSIGAMGMRGNIVRRWEAANARSLEHSTRSQVRNRWLQVCARFTRVCLLLLVIATAAWLIIIGEMTGGALLASMLLMRRAISPVERAIGSWQSVLRARRALGRVAQHMARPREDAPNFQRPEGALTVKRLRYYHPDATTPVLRKVSFNVEPGEAVALVGPTGAGKSTLANLLVGNEAPHSGHVYLGDTEVTAWDPEALGPYIGYLPQTVALFEGTIAENIERMGSSNPRWVFAATEVAGITEMVRALPEGLQTRVGPDGIKLSGGQRQRIGLARAVFGMPRFVVLDEPDSNLDREGREALDRAIAILKSYSRIVIVITHQARLGGTIDRIVELREGQVEESRPRRKTGGGTPRLVDAKQS